jgi:predicted Zn-ribbon and HTH transcriptional regulator
MDKRTCKVCNLEKELSEFPARISKRLLTKTAQCNKCRYTKANARVASNPVLRATKIVSMQKSYKKTKALEPEKLMVKEARKRAKREGVVCTITPADIYIPKFCPLMGIPLKFNYGEKAASPNSPSLDKIYPDKGYIPGNVMVISNAANVAKSNLTPQQLISIGRNLSNVVNNMYPFHVEEAKALSPTPYEKPTLEEVQRLSDKAKREREEQEGASGGAVAAEVEGPVTENIILQPQVQQHVEAVDNIVVEVGEQIKEEVNNIQEGVVGGEEVNRREQSDISQPIQLELAL